MLLAAIAAIGFVLWTTAGARPAAHRFLEDVREHRYERAYELTSRGLRRRVPPGDLAGYLERSAPAVSRSTGAWIHGLTFGFDEGCFAISLGGADLPHRTVFVTVVKEEGEWRVDDVSAREPPACSGD